MASLSTPMMKIGTSDQYWRVAFISECSQIGFRVVSATPVAGKRGRSHWHETVRAALWRPGTRWIVLDIIVVFAELKRSLLRPQRTWGSFYTRSFFMELCDNVLQKLNKKKKERKKNEKKTEQSALKCQHIQNELLQATASKLLCEIKGCCAGIIYFHICECVNINT